MTSGYTLFLFGAGDWSSLITLVVLLALSGLSTLLQRRSGKPGDEEQDEPRPSGPGPRPQPQPSESAGDWETELRRLLGQPPPPPPREAARPPALPREIAPSVPKSAPPLAQAPILRDRFEEEGPRTQLPHLIESKTVLDRAGSLNEKVTARLHRVSEGLGRLTESSAALAEASHLQADVYQHMQQGIARSQQSPETRPARTRSPQASAVLSLLRTRAGTQQAILASLVLGPPKGLEP